MEATEKIDLAWVKDTSISYKGYVNTIFKMVQEKSTSGADQSDERIELTKLNMHRMKRINEATLDLAVTNLKKPVGVLIITEAWCGDSAQNVPWLEHYLNSCNPTIESYYFFRDEHPELMNLFLTNGSRSIPKYVFFNKENGEVLATWGPRPTEIKNWLADFRTTHPEITKHEWEIELHKYYTKNKGEAMLTDLKEIISNFS